LKSKLNRRTGEKDVLLGNEAIARGAIEAGIKVAAAYPGTPSSEIMEVLLQEAPDFGYYAEWSINEKVAFELAAGASLTGVRALSAMKGAGLNVVMDMFMTLPYTGIKGGYVVVVADDPGAHYSSNEQDSRFAAQWAKVPCLEPEDQQEAKNMTKAAFEISEQLELPVVIRTVTRLSHSSGVVEYGEINNPSEPAGFNKHYDLPYRWNVYGPPGAVQKHEWQINQISKMQTAADLSKFNSLKEGTTRYGVITAGLGSAYSKEALRVLGKLDDLWFLKCGWAYPIPEIYCLKMLSTCDNILIVEEGDPVIETQLRLLAQSNGFSTHITGKINGQDLPLCGELNTQIVRTSLMHFLGLSEVHNRFRANLKEQAQKLVAPRSSTLCAGCSHLATYWSLKQAAQTNKNTIPIINGDIGCYEQAGYGIKGEMPIPSKDNAAHYPTRTPYNFLDTLYIMGSGISMAQGEVRAGYQNGEVVAVAGDSTFFHTCMPGLLNAVWNDTKVTFVVMDNSWTAMTGHQVDPSSGFNGRGATTPKILIEDVARSLGVQFIKAVNAYDVEQTSQAIKEAIAFPGVAVIVSRAECMLQVLRKEGKKIAQSHIREVCTGCKICLQIGCPAINFQDRKAHIDPLLCVDCGLCIQVCPHQAISKENSYES
jgi:indolepyruvate ferredoxin oxidoreductase alpha subunit